MPEVVKIPFTQLSKFDESQKAYYLEQKAKIEKRFGSIINEYCSPDFVNVPSILNYSTMLIENDGGNEKLISIAGAVGLKQIKVLSATDILINENKKNQLSEVEKNELRKLLGKTKADSIFKASLGTKIITQSDLLNPRINILIGTIYLSTLLSEHNSRFDLVGYRYNQGYYSKISGSSAKNYKAGTDALLKDTSGEGRSYIIKLVGKNGMLDFLK